MLCKHCCASFVVCKVTRGLYILSAAAVFCPKYFCPRVGWNARIPRQMCITKDFSPEPSVSGWVSYRWLQQTGNEHRYGTPVFFQPCALPVVLMSPDRNGSGSGSWVNLAFMSLVFSLQLLSWLCCLDMSGVSWICGMPLVCVYRCFLSWLRQSILSQECHSGDTSCVPCTSMLSITECSLWSLIVWISPIWSWV